MAREVKEIEALAAEGKNPSPPEGALLPNFTYWPWLSDSSNFFILH